MIRNVTKMFFRRIIENLPFMKMDASPKYRVIVEAKKFVFEIALVSFSIMFSFNAFWQQIYLKISDFPIFRVEVRIEIIAIEIQANVVTPNNFFARFGYR